MCFAIYDLAKRPRQKYAWKVIRTREDGYARSVLWGRDYIWQPGVKRKRSKGSTSYFGSVSHGIYVYLTHEVSARYFHRCYGSDCYMMKVHVSPDEWLHTSRCGEVATYESATPCEKQPHFDWVD